MYDDAQLAQRSSDRAIIKLVPSIKINLIRSDGKNPVFSETTHRKEGLPSRLKHRNKDRGSFPLDRRGGSRFKARACGGSGDKTVIVGRTIEVKGPEDLETRRLGLRYSMNI